MEHGMIRPARALAFAIALAVIWTFSALLGSDAHAEWYVAGQLGYTMPNGLSNVEGTGPTTGVKTSDLEQINSPLLGFKVGRFFESLPWLGLEGDFYYATPHVEQQSVTKVAGRAPFQVRQTVMSPGFHMSLFSGTINLIARYPGKRFQPYIGGGAGVGWARVSGVNTFAVGTGRPTIDSSSDAGIMLTALVGSRFFLTKHVALFGEYKYSTTSFEFGGNIQVKADYSAHNLVAGVALHF